MSSSAKPPLDRIAIEVPRKLQAAARPRDAELAASALLLPSI